MASANMDELDCSICMNLYTDPVSLRCGHNYCRECIDRVLDTQEGSGLYSCPLCRAEDQERPALEKNRKLCNLVERFLSTQPEPEETKICCTYCVESPVLAAKTCLHCETTLCNKHLRSHNKSVDHILIDPMTSRESITCSIHKKMLTYYCSVDGACVCVACFASGDHRGHLVETISEASEKKMEKLQNLLDKLTSEKWEIEMRLLRLQEHMEGVQEEAAGVTMRVTSLFKDLQEELEALEMRVLAEISRQTNQISLKISSLVQQLEIRKEALSRNICHVQDLSNRDNPISVLQGQESDYNDVCDSTDGDANGKRDEKTMHAIGDLNKGLVSETLHTGMSDIVTGVKRKFYLQEVLPITMDLNTAHGRMELSDDLKTVSDCGIIHDRPQSPSRFSVYNQVLSIHSFTTGQHYWEVETSAEGIWDVGLAYASIERDGKRSGIGDDHRSWCLRKYTKWYMTAHNSKVQSLLLKQCSQLIGIYLDYEAGCLTFYELCDLDRHIYRHLHTFTATFTEPLHAVIYVDDGAWVSVIH